MRDSRKGDEMKQNVESCDVCGKIKSPPDIKYKQMQMLRYFDSSDGRSFYDHLVVGKIDICDTCFEKVIESKKFLVDNRVQGHGTIEIQND